MKEVILVTENGEPTGTAPLLPAHTMPGQLHAAFSVFIFRDDTGELLLQKRSDTKPLFAGHWANTCCSHPLPGEDVLTAGQRRLQEELGFSCTLERIQSFVYRAEDPTTGLVEHEYDTVLTGHILTAPDLQPNPEEVAATRWITKADLQKEFQNPAEPIAPWLPLAFNILLQHQS